MGAFIKDYLTLCGFLLASFNSRESFNRGIHFQDCSSNLS